MSTSSVILFNPNASAWQRQKDQLATIVRRFDAKMLELDRAGVWLQRLVNAQHDRICVYGGDGTLSGVIQALDHESGLERFDIGLIPGGTGNDLARSIGLHGLPLDQAFQIAMEGQTTPVDLIDVSNGTSLPIVNAATAGFGGLVSGDLTSPDKQRWGAMAYWVAAFTHLTSLPSFNIELSFDDETKRRFDVFGLAITSGRYVGGGFPVSPRASVNDGRLNVTVVPVMPLSVLLASGVEFTLGQFSETSEIATFQARRVRVTSNPRLPYSLDGETQQSEQAEFVLRPAALRIACGPNAACVKLASGRQSGTVA